MWTDIQNFELTWQNEIGNLVDLKETVTVNNGLNIARSLVTGDGFGNLALVKCTDLI